MRTGLSLGFVVLAAASTAQGQVFQPLPRGATTNALYPASYNLGRVLGERAFGFEGNGVPEGPWIWTRSSGTFTVIPAPAAPLSIWSMNAISGDGTKVGGAVYNAATEQVLGATCAFGGGVVVRGAAPGDAYSVFYASNQAGTVMGGEGGAPGQNAIKWTNGVGVTRFPVPDAEVSRITGMSDDASVIVGIALDENFTSMRAWRWTASTGVVELPQDRNWTFPRVSAGGAWVLGRNGDTNTEQTTYRWSVAGGREDLPMPDGGTSITGVGISDDGSVVVGIAFTGDLVGHPWVWREGYGSILLDRVLAARLPAATLNGWKLSELVAISRDGTEALGIGELDGAATMFIVELPAACPADFGRSGGVTGVDGALDNNDFIAFINLFFATDARADIAGAGGLPTPDGAWDNNDFIAFVAAFFNGCP